MTELRTSPDHETKGWPPGVPFIIGNEGCERFSFYGMRSILTLYMAEVLYRDHPAFRDNPDSYAQAHYHLFVAAVYCLPMVGAIFADRLLGKYRTILYLSLVYTLGHGVLAVAETSVYGMWFGLGLIAIGSGGIKPCVSANVGDQFGRNNWFRMRSIYQAFYFIINFGSFFATLLIPVLWREVGASVAFGVPGLLMALATLVFWLGRKKYVHIPAKPAGKLGLLDALSSTLLFMAVGHLFFSKSLAWWMLLLISAGFLALGLLVFQLRQRIEQDDGFLAVTFYALRSALSSAKPKLKNKSELPTFFLPAVEKFGKATVEGPVAVLRIMSVFFLVSIFWSLFDQHGSSWVLQAKQMNLTLDLPLYGELSLRASQVGALNPLLVMLLIPITGKLLYPAVEKLGFKLSPLRRITIGMLVAALSFVAVALIQLRIDALGPGKVSVGWQFVPYVIITLAEVMVSITGLEFAYTQAPKRMKSTIMGFWMLTVALGNVLVTIVSYIQLPPAQFFWVFAALMAGAGALFGLRAYFYRERDYIQD